MEKEEVLENWYNMIKKSWTYDRLTSKERQRLDDVITSCQLNNCLSGTARHRWNILQAIYYSYLLGVGYDSPNWRQEQS